jgi:hypothetical protein
VLHDTERKGLHWIRWKQRNKGAMKKRREERKEEESRGEERRRE